MRGRRYKAVPDTSFIRFGRSGGDREQDDSDRDLESNPLFQTTGDTAFDREGESPDASGLTNNMNFLIPMEKKARPERYYLRFG